MKLPGLSVAILSLTAAIASAAPGDLDTAFLTGIGAGLTPNNYPNHTHLDGTGAVNAVALQPDGKIIAGGNVSKYNGAGALNSLKRLNVDGTLDATFNSGGAGLTVTSGQTEVNTLLVEPDGSFFVGGTFTSYNGTNRGGFLKLNADGTLNTTFAFSAVGGTSRYVLTSAKQGTKVLIGGGFTTVNGQGGYLNFARLNADGSLDTTFTSAGLTTNAQVRRIAVDANGRIYVAGTEFNPATSRNEPLLRRYFAEGARDFSFAPAWGNDYGSIAAVLPLADGRVVISGSFALQGISGIRNYACLTANGSIASDFQQDAGGNGDVMDLRLSLDGRIIASGIFTSLGGQTRASIGILNLDGTIDPDFAPQPYKTRNDGYVTHFYSLAQQADGRIVAGGWFERVTDPNLPANNLTRFEGDFATGPGKLGFTGPGFVVNENAGTATISVVRHAGLTGAVSVNFSMSPTSAGTSDYTDTAGTLSWAAGEGGIKTITVPVTNDALAESTEIAALLLSSPTGGATLSRQLSALFIRDDDSAPTILVHPGGGNVDQGETLTFVVAFDSAIAATVKWQFDSGSGFADIPGATSPSYTISTANPATHAGIYRAVVTNSNGATNSNSATLNVVIPAGALVNAFNPTHALTSILASGLDPAGNLLTAGSNGIVRLTSAGVVDPTFAPTFNNAVYSLIPLPDGSMFAAGSFTTVNSTARNYFAHINADGTLDTAANLSLTQVVNTMALGAGNKLYIGHAGAQGLKRYTLSGANGTLDASFTTLALSGTSAIYRVKERADGKIFVAYTTNSSSYNFRLLTNAGAADASFTPPTITGGAPTDWDILPDGRIVLIGSFATINGTTCRGIAVLKADGALDTSYDFTTAFVYNPAGVRYLNGRILVWGQFTTYKTTAIAGIARLNLDGTLDPTFKVAGGVTNLNSVSTVTVLPDQRLFIGGNFSSFRGVARNRLALLEAGPTVLGLAAVSYGVIENAGSLIVTVKRFAPAPGAVSIGYTTGNGTATDSGDFTAASGTLSWAAGDVTDRTVTIPITNDSIGEALENFEFKLNPASLTGEASLATTTATIAITDDDNPPFIVTPPQTQTVGQGTTATFTVVANSTPAATYRWTFNGTDLSDGAGISGTATATLTITNAGPTHVGAYRVRLTNSNGPTTSSPAQLIVNLNPAFVDHTWTTNLTINGRINVILPLPDGGAYIGGQFTNFNGQTGRNYLVKINAAGVVDTNFSPAPNGYVLQLRLVDNRLYVLADFTGPFSTIGGGASVSGFAALDAATGARLAPFMTALGTGATSFTSVRALAVAPDGDVILGGDFSSFNNNFNHHYLARINPDGSLDSGWNTSQAAPVSGTALVVTAVEVGADGKVIAGGTISHQGASRLIRLNADGTRDTTFAPEVNVNNTTVTRIKIQPDGRVFVTGSSLPGGRTIVRLTATGAWTFTDYPGTTSGNFYDLALQRNGRTLGVGQFSFVRQPSGTFNNIARFDLTGTLEQAWPTGVAFDGAAYSIALAEDGKIWVGGDFLNYNGTAAQRLIRLNGDAIPLGITLQPKSTEVNPGATVALTARATGTSAITYEWRRNGTPLTNGGDISGADTATLSIANAAEDDEGTYTLRVTNLSGEETSAGAALVVLGAPEVVTQPSTLTTFGNRPYSISVNVRGIAPLVFQWKHNGTALTEGVDGITGTNTATLTFANLPLNYGGTYTLEITNGSGTTTSQPITLTVNPHPTDRAAAFSSVTGTNPTTIYSILPLPDGGALLGGSFNSIQGANSTSSGGRIARVLPNGQVATLPFTLNSNVRAMAIQPDGKILIGGEFTAVTPTSQSTVTRNRIARLNADFTFDPTFDVGAGAPSQTVSAIKVDAIGRIYVGGSFASWGNSALGSYLVRLRPNGTIDPAFSTSLNNYVNDIDIDATGRVYIGGQFTNYQGGSSIIRLQANGARDTTFASAVFGTILDIALQADGKLLAAVNGEGLRRLTDTGAFDSGFPNTNQTGVSAFVLQADGQILVTGSFTSYGGFNYRGLVRLNSAGVVDPVFEILGNTTASVVQIDGYGRIWAGGNFTVFNNVITNVRGLYVMNGDAVALGFVRKPLPVAIEPGQTATFAASATATSAITYRWLRNGAPVANGGRISGATTDTLTITGVVAGDADNYTLEISTAGGATRTSTAELAVLGQPEVLIAPVAQTIEAGQAVSFYVQARGAGTLTYQWLKAGAPLTNGSAFSGVTTSTFTINPLILADAGNYSVRITGSAGTTTTTPVNLTVTVNPAGVNRTLALPKFNSTVTAIAPNDDGTFFVGGSFTQITPPGASAVSRNRFAKIKADGTIDTAWPTLNNQPYAIAKDSTGRVYIGGSFSQVTPNGGSAVTRNYLVRLNADGSLDTTFNAPGGVPAAGPSNQVKGIKFDATGRVYIHGDFATYNGTTVNYLARLNADGSLDTSFTSVTNSFVYDLKFAADGRHWISHGGNWSGQYYLVLTSAAGVRDAGFTYSGSLMPSAMALTSAGSVINVSNSWPYLQKVGPTGAVSAESFQAVNNGLRLITGNGSQFYLWGPSVTTYGSTTVANLFRINADGTHDASFTPSTGAGVGSGTVETMVIDSQGRLWVGGNFGSYNGDTTLANFFVLNGGDPQTNSGPPADPFADFVAGVPEGQRGPSDDPDGDGASNLLEYALALDPMVASSTGLPEVLVVSNRLTFVYERVRNDVTYTVETSTNLTTWTTVDVDQGTPDGEGVTVASVAMDVPNRFLRLKVER